MKIPFNKPYMTGRELGYISEAHFRGHLSGDGSFTQRCHQWIEERTGCDKALLTHSCTAALEMAAILAEFQAGDEVIMPSFTFVSTANALVDIRPGTLNIDGKLIESVMNEKKQAYCSDPLCRGRL